VRDQGRAEGVWMASKAEAKEPPEEEEEEEEEGAMVGDKERVGGGFRVRCSKR
jgi:hypothetical protein